MTQQSLTDLNHKKKKQGSLHPTLPAADSPAPYKDEKNNTPQEDPPAPGLPEDSRTSGGPPDTASSGGLSEDGPSGDDQTLLEKWLLGTGRGEKEAFCSLYGHTRRILFSYALSLLHNREDAEDAMQDTFLKIRSAAHLYRPMGKPLAWMITIERNLCLMRLREQNRYGGQGSLEEITAKPGSASPAPVTAKAPGSRPEDVEDRLLLQDALRALTREESSIVLLHASAGLRHREIADQLQLPLSTVLSKYRRALEKLRRKLQ